MERNSCGSPKPNEEVEEQQDSLSPVLDTKRYYKRPKRKPDDKSFSSKLSQDFESESEKQIFKIPFSPIAKTKVPKQRSNPKKDEFMSESSIQLGKIMFQTGSGKEIKISEEKLKKCSVIFEDIFESPEEVNKLSKTELKSKSDLENEEFYNSEISDSQICLAVDDILNSFGEDKTEDKVVIEDSFKGFGSKEQENSKKLSQYLDKLVESFIYQDFDKQPFKVMKKSIFSVSRKVDKKRKESFELPPSKFQACEFQSLSKTGFNTAAGKGIKLTTSALKLAEAKYQDCLNLEDAVTPSKPFCKASGEVIKETELDKSESIGFAKASGQTVSLNPETLKLIEAKFKDCFDFQCPSSTSLLASKLDLSSKPKTNLELNKPQTPPQLQPKRLGFSGCKPLSISNKSIEKAKKLFEETPEQKPSTPSNLNRIFNSTPIPKSKKCLESSYSPLSIKTSIKDQSILLKKPSDYETIDDLYQELERQRLKLEADLKKVVFKQRNLIMNKNLMERSGLEYRKPKPGFLYSSEANNMSLERLDLAGAEVEDTNITLENASEVHFSCSDQDPSTLVTKDGAVLVPNADDLVGLKEIEFAFLSAPNIDPLLVPPGWVENHFKLIVWKLSNFKANEDPLEVLSIENIMNQLKYRYDKEIDMAERPALRKICEGDDSAQKRMVLCVCRLCGEEVFVTDGWYQIKAALDEPLSQLLKSNTIRIGTKLLICNAELISQSPCHPLNIDDSTLLRISFNSTRLAEKGAKLGYQEDPGPIIIPVKEIRYLGGPISCIKVYVARIFPLLYVELNDHSNVWRNKKAEDKRCLEWERTRNKKIEEIQEQIQKNFEMEKRSSREVKSYSKAELGTISCAKTLYEILKTSKDSECLEELLSNVQRKAVLEYHHNFMNMKRQEINEKIRENVEKLKLAKREVKVIQKMIVMDVDGSPESFSTLNISDPGEELLERLGEGAVILGMNLKPGASSIYSNRRSRFEVVEALNEKLHEKFKRTVVPIALVTEIGSKSPFNVLDTVGIVVQVRIELLYQELWLTDTVGRLLQVRIYESSNSCSILEGLTNGEAVCGCNLTVRRSFENFAEATGNITSFFTASPKQQYLQEALTLFKKFFPKDLEGLMKESLKKIANLEVKLEGSRSVYKKE